MSARAGSIRSRRPRRRARRLAKRPQAGLASAALEVLRSAATTFRAPRAAGHGRRAPGRARRGPRLLRAVAALLARLSPRALSPRARRRLFVVAAVVLLLLAGYRFWLRDSSFVAVERVTVTGLTTADAERVRTALTAAGRTMTTLHVDRTALERVAAGYPAVRALEVTTDFPHGLRVHVIEHVPVAIAASDSVRVPVAADGTILRGLPVEGRLPSIDVEGAIGSDRLEDGDARAASAVAGAAPEVLRSRIDEVERRGGDGLVAELRDGPELIFGNSRRLRAKWAAAARVLADLEARGASYIDLRIASRPAVGGLPAETVTPVAPPGTVSAPPSAVGATDPTAAATADPAAPVDPAATVTDPAAGTPTSPTPATTQPTPTAPVTGGAEGGATAAP